MATTKLFLAFVLKGELKDVKTISAIKQNLSIDKCLQFLYLNQERPTELMDPTKPILDLNYQQWDQGDRKYSKQPSRKIHHHPNKSRPISNYINYHQQYQKKSVHQPSYTQLKEKFKQLIQVNRQKELKYQNQTQQLKNLQQQHQELRKELNTINEQNEQKQRTIFQINNKIEQHKKKVQSFTHRKNSYQSTPHMDRLQSGLEQAIHQNYQLLKESALNQLKYFLQ